MPGISRVKDSRSPYYNGLAGQATYTVGAYVTNVATINIQIKNNAYKAPTVPVKLDWYFSNDAQGQSLAAATSGAVAAGARGQVVNLVTGRMGYLVTNATGGVDVSITDVTVRSMYLVLVMPDGSLNVSPVITHP